MSAALLLPSIPFARLPKNGRYVYVIQAENGLIKVGCSHQPRTRVKGLFAWSALPMWVVACVKGRRELETAILGRLAESLHHNEWISPTPEAIRFFTVELKPFVRELRRRQDIWGRLCWGDVRPYAQALNEAKKRQKHLLLERDGTPRRAA